ncbi:hypothetical protein BKA80DRAFT_255166 [Phyllosticta citrichinensis]
MFFSSSSSSSSSPPILMSSSPPIDFRNYYSGKDEDLEHYIRRAYRLHGIYYMLKFTQAFPAKAAALDLFIHAFDPNMEFYDHLFTNRRGWFPFYWDDECLDPDKFSTALDDFMRITAFRRFWDRDTIRHRKRVCVERQERHAQLLAAHVLRTGFSFVLKLFQFFQSLKSSSRSRSRSSSLGHSRGRSRNRSRRAQLSDKHNQPERLYIPANTIFACTTPSSTSCKSQALLNIQQCPSNRSREPNAPTTSMASSLTNLRRAYRNSENDLRRHLCEAYRLHHICDMLKFTQFFPHEAAKLRLFIETFDPDREHYASLFTIWGKQPFEGEDECLESDAFTDALEDFLVIRDFDYFWQDDTIRHRAQAYVAEQEEVVQILAEFFIDRVISFVGRLATSGARYLATR